jgi:RNA polymerase sigma-70 factor (ECF subfamily)
MKVLCNKVEEIRKTGADAAVKAANTKDIAMLIDKAADGNFEAYGQLYSIFLDRIYRYVFYQVKNKMTAEDITEEVFVKAWKAIRSCKGKSQTFSAWIYRIAHNHIINTLRNSQKCVSIDNENVIDIDDPKSEIETRLDQRELMDAVAELPENQKQVIILKFIEGMDNREIRQIIKKSEGAIRILQMRALCTLRQKLGSRRFGDGT